MPATSIRAALPPRHLRRYRASTGDHARRADRAGTLRPRARDRRSHGRCLRNAARPRAGRSGGVVARSPTCHLSSRPTLRTRPSTRSKSSCRSCKRSGSFQLVPLVVGDAAPRQSRRVLRRLWGGPETLIVVSSICPTITTTTPRGGSMRRPPPPSSAATGQSRPRPSLRLSCRGRPAGGSRSPRPHGAAALTVQFGRHGGLARPGRRIRSLDIGGDASRPVS